ncbi:S8 family peptidase [Chakrabartyella piscis]|uniref:S8 family peptidase n=1 Tax=Chakrabartyella piscis TaxID=2918914 RepID=UPI0029583C3B|nr:S8 family peptidase [Chakrabartyella piscis]
MKKTTSLLLAITLIVGMVGTSSINVSAATVEAYHLNQPINREIVDRNQMNQQAPQVETNQIYDDPYLSYQWAITETGADLAWESITNDSSVLVAVVDTGVDYSHEDLENRVRVDLGYDFVNNDSDPIDDNGHGTHVSGIIAAEANNGVGISGMAGELDVNIIPIKVLDADGAGETANIAKGILYAVEQGANVINLSLGADVITPEVRSAIETALEANVFVVVAAGNDGTLCAPLSLANIDGVFTVSAATVDNLVAEFSNYGDCIDAYAPGVDVLSTYLDNQYAYQDGTSMAAPVVSGAAAILLSENADLTVAELTELLRDDTAAIPVPTTPNTQTAMQNTQVATPNTPPTLQPIARIQAVQNTPMTNMPVNNTPVTTQTTMQSSMTTNCNIINVYEVLLKVLS